MRSIREKGGSAREVVAREDARVADRARDPVALGVGSKKRSQPLRSRRAPRSSPGTRPAARARIAPLADVGPEDLDPDVACRASEELEHGDRERVASSPVEQPGTQIRTGRPRRGRSSSAGNTSAFERREDLRIAEELVTSMNRSSWRGVSSSGSPRGRAEVLGSLRLADEAIQRATRRRSVVGL